MADRARFDEFVVACSPRLAGTAYLLTRDEGAAEDLVQETLVKVWRVWRRVDGDPWPYARQVLVRTFLSARRRRRLREVPMAEMAEVAGLVSGGVEERETVWAALARLPRRQQAVLVLRYFEDLTETQTAALLQVSVGTVKSQASKALARLRIDATLTPAHRAQED